MRNKYTIKTCSGYWRDEPSRILSGVQVALESWDGKEDAEDSSVFYYMDGEPLAINSVIAEDFIVTEIEGLK
tara:strand:+ start:6947 stop:7162 length:216 start_codon:yes stop_codon:yes gene_type:complete